MEIFEVEEKVKDLVVEELKSHVIIVDNQEMFLGTMRALQRNVRIVNHLIILSNYVYS